MERSLTGQKDADLIILSNLDDRSLLSFCSTSQYGRTLCQNETFWRNRFLNKFGKHFKSPNRTWKDFYLKVVYYFDKNEDDLNDAMGNAARGGHMDIVNFFINKGATNWNWGM